MNRSKLNKLMGAIKQSVCLAGAVVVTVVVYGLFGYRIYESITGDFSAWVFIILISLAAGGYLSIENTKGSIKESALSFIGGFLGIFLVMAFLTGGNGCSMPKYYNDADYDAEQGGPCYDGRGPHEC